MRGAIWLGFLFSEPIYKRKDFLVEFQICILKCYINFVADITPSGPNFPRPSFRMPYLSRRSILWYHLAVGQGMKNHNKEMDILQRLLHCKMLDFSICATHFLFVWKKKRRKEARNKFWNRFVFRKEISKIVKLFFTIVIGHAQNLFRPER